ncbi:uncharacterized protein LOC144351882 [Saccoglossus kowalevskii]
MPKRKNQSKLTFSEERSAKPLIDTLATVFAGQTARTAESQKYRKWLPGKSKVGRILLHDNGGQDRLLDMKVSGLEQAQKRTATFLAQQQNSFVNRMERKQDAWTKEHSRRAVQLNQLGPKKHQNENLGDSPRTESGKKDLNSAELSLPKIPRSARNDASTPDLTPRFRSRKPMQFPGIGNHTNNHVSKIDDNKTDQESEEKSDEKNGKHVREGKAREKSTISENLPRITVTNETSHRIRKRRRQLTPPSITSLKPQDDARFTQLTNSLSRLHVSRNNQVLTVSAVVSGFLRGNKFLKKWKHKHSRDKADTDEFYLT